MGTTIGTPRSFHGRRTGAKEELLMKATKMTLAAAVLVGTCGFAMAQGAGGEAPKGSDANPPAATKAQPGETKSVPAQGAQAPAASGSQTGQNPKAPNGRAAWRG